MPCYNPPMTPAERLHYASAGGPDLSEAEMEALLCAFMTRHGLDSINWGQCGVHRPLVEGWWSAHQEKDRKKLKRKGN